MSQPNVMFPHQHRALPNYTLQIPTPIGYLLGLAVLSGVIGSLLTFTALENRRIVAYLLLTVAGLGGILAFMLIVVTGKFRRLRARQKMLTMVTWRGDEHVLDVGCGNGFLLVEAAKHLTTGKATGIDVWMTDAGKQTTDDALRNAQIEGVADRVDVQNIDARTMPFEDSSFDVILSSLMLHHAGSQDDRQRVIAEMSRVLKPGGTILLYDMFPIITGAREQLQTARNIQIDHASGILMNVLCARKLQ